MGVDRSAIFVALAVLIQQIRTEKKADVFSVVRKLRCQRQGMLDSFVSCSEKAYILKSKKLQHKFLIFNGVIRKIILFDNLIAKAKRK
jgi:Protein-tyrosine phosphatase